MIGDIIMILLLMHIKMRVEFDIDFRSLDLYKKCLI